MKAYVLHGINDLRMEEWKKPEVEKGQVMVNVKAAGICGSDVPRVFETGTYSFPLIPGHEFAGVVAEVGEGVSTDWIGKRVGVFPLIPCQKCSACQKKQYEMCSNYNYLGSRCDGGFAEYVQVPEWNLIEIPKEMDMREAAMLEPAAVALHAVRQLQVSGKERVVLFGLGTIGVIMAQWFRYFGISVLLAVGHYEEFGNIMRETADPGYEFCNAHEIDSISWVSEKTKGEGADIIVDCIGSSKSLSDALDCVMPGGKILVVANPKGDLHLSKEIYWKLLRKQVQMVGTWNSSFRHEENDDWHRVIQACVEGKLHLLPSISHEFTLEELKEGLNIMKKKSEYRNKVMVIEER